MARPGIMLYFDILEPIRVLPDADKGRLLVAMLEYGKSGIAPEFDGMLALAWGFVKPKIDKDEAEYNLSVMRRQYATVCRERKRKGEAEISFDEWVRTNGYHTSSMMTIDNQWYPTTTTTTTTNTTPSTTTAAAATTTTNGLTTSGGLRMIGGNLGKGVVALTDMQMGELLDKLGLEMFDYYVDKLSDFILKNDAKVQNHYETILKWWRQDSNVESQKEEG